MKKIAALLLICLHALGTYACSTFLISRNAHHYFGRNYDFVTGNGMIMINQRNKVKGSFDPVTTKQFTWTSRFGSITFNQFGIEMPQGGMNEKGLVVELMWLDETRYPATDSRNGIAELQWIQYQLDCSETIDDVIESDAFIRINEKNSAPLHFLIADANGKAATIEFLNGKMVVHRGEQLPYAVLTNSPYADALAQVKAKQAQSFADNSLQRFRTACKLVSEFQKAPASVNPVDYSFDILKQVAQPGATRWSIVYDISNKKIYYTSDKNKQRRLVSFSDFNFDCAEKSLALDINMDASGAVANHFVPLSFDANKKLIAQSAEEIKSIMNFSNEAVEATANIYRKSSCRK